MNQRLEKLKEMERQKPDDAFIKFAIAQEYVHTHNDEKAVIYFELLLEAFPEYVPTYYQYGKLYERINDFAAAANVYKKGITVAKAANELKTVGELNEALMLVEDEQG